MAGIGFRLQKLLKEDSYSAVAEGYVYSAAASAGPWLVTIGSLGLIGAVTADRLSDAERALFRGLVVHVYALSLVVTGVYQMVASRHLADRIWLRDEEAILPGFATLLLATAVFQGGTGAALAGLCGLDLPLATGAAGLYAVVSCLWIALVFLSAAKDYERIFLAFAAGAAVSVGAAALLVRQGGGVAGCLHGFLAGQLATLALLAAHVFREFDARRAFDLDILRAAGRHSDLALAGLLYNLGIWVDKVVFAWSPGGVEVAPGLRSHPVYEGAMFLAYLTVVPALSLFVIRIETSFYATFRDFFGAIVAHRTLRDIRLRREQIAEKLRVSVARLLKLQGTITALAVVAGPALLDALALDPLVAVVFRTCAIAAMLQVLFLLLFTGLFYFERRATAVAVAATFCTLNGVLSWLTSRLGVEWHGYGYLAACLAATVAAYLAFDRAVADVEFETFMRQPLAPRPLDVPQISKAETRGRRN